MLFEIHCKATGFICIYQMFSGEIEWGRENIGMVNECSGFFSCFYEAMAIR